MRPYSSGGSGSAMVVADLGAADCASCASSSADLRRGSRPGRPPAGGATAAARRSWIDLGADVGLGAVARARRLGDRVLHGGDDDAAVDRLLAGDRVGDLQQLEPVGADGHRSFSFVPSPFARDRTDVIVRLSSPISVELRRGRARLRALPCRACSDSAISASVSTSLASAMSSIGSSTGGFAARRRRRDGCAPRRPRRRAAARRGTACGHRSRPPSRP